MLNLVQFNSHGFLQSFEDLVVLALHRLLREVSLEPLIAVGAITRKAFDAINQRDAGFLKMTVTKSESSQGVTPMREPSVTCGGWCSLDLCQCAKSENSPNVARYQNRRRHLELASHGSRARNPTILSSGHVALITAACFPAAADVR